MASVIRRSLHSLATNGPILPATRTPIQSFYSGKDIFITGATGFMGKKGLPSMVYMSHRDEANFIWKVLLEKLLWSCPDIGNIYVLSRSKKGVDTQSRFDNMFNTAVFERVSRDVPGFREKVKIMEGDCEKPELGLTDVDKDILTNQVNVIFHVAATIRFNEPLHFSTMLNVRAVRDLLLLSRTMRNLKSFIHVSTAMSQAHSDTLDEVFYHSPMDSLNVIDFVETADPQMVEKVAPIFQGKWPNMYTFTKSLGENVVKQCAVGLPIGIFRPPIVMSSYREPQPRWVDNRNAVSGYHYYAGLGIIRAAWCTKGGTINMVPVDMCVNGLISCAWEVAEHFEKREVKKSTSDDITIYNYVLADNPVKFSDNYDLVSLDGAKYPSLQTVNYHTYWKQAGHTTHRLAKMFLHYVPAIVSDAGLLCIGKTPKHVKMYKKFDFYEDTVYGIMKVEWKFSNENIKKMISRMTEEDRKLFYCDVRDIDWNEFFDGLFLGIRRYLIKEDDSTLPEARKRYNRLRVERHIAQLFFVLLLGGGSWEVYNYLKQVPTD